MLKLNYALSAPQLPTVQIYDIFARCSNTIFRVNKFIIQQQIEKNFRKGQQLHRPAQ